MVATASDRGLSDPYDPRVAIPAAAAYLRELKTTFGGSLGLAAAAYNAGPRAVREWLVGRRPLPRETVAYVSAVTGEDLAPRGPPSAVGAFAIGAPTRPDTRELAPEAALCVRLSTSERPCRVQKTY
jgi:hypothetical protein